MGQGVACRAPVLPLSPALPPPLPSPRPLNKYLLNLCCVSCGVWRLKWGVDPDLALKPWVLGSEAPT